VRKWDARTYAAWKTLLLEGDGLKEGEGEGYQERVKRVGLGFKESRNFWGKEGVETEGGDGVGLWWSRSGVVDGFSTLSQDELPEGAVMGVKYRSICINVPRYLGYLYERIQELGAKVVKGTFDTSHGLEGAVASAKEILKENGVGEDVDVVINCTGLSSRLFLPAQEAEKLFPIRGQTVLVKGEARIARTYTDFSDDSEELLYVIPRPGSNTTILGGCKQVDNLNVEIDEELSQRILERVKEFELAEELRTGDGREFEVLGTQVGFRPGRKGGPRVESERVGSDWVVHSYGHGGGGYQCSVGCAEEVVGLIEKLVDE